MNYDLAYYENLLRIQAKTAEDICKIRWDFIKDIDASLILDYGSGIGWFKAFSPNGTNIDTFDIADYPQTGIRHKFYDLVCFWDVLEHIPNFQVIDGLLKRTANIALTLPIKPNDINLEKWKHFKPGEHLTYFTEESLDKYLRKYKFNLIKMGMPECPPREDIVSFLYAKNHS